MKCATRIGLKCTIRIGMKCTTEMSYTPKKGGIST